MAGRQFNRSSSSRTKAAASTLSRSSGPTSFNGVPEFSYLHTEPVLQGNPSSQVWTNGAVEGQQYLNQLPSTSLGQSPNGITDSFNPFLAPQNASTSQETGQRATSGATNSHWDPKHSSVHITSQDMLRLSSQETAMGADTQGITPATNSYDQTRSARMYHDLPEISFPISSVSSDGSDRSNSPELYTSPHQLDNQSFDGFSYQGTEEIVGDQSVYQGNSNHGLISSASYSNVFAGDEVYYVPSQGPVSPLLFSANSIDESATIWDNSIQFMHSHTSSPHIHEGDNWPVSPSNLMTATNSPLGYSPGTESIESLSPNRFVQDFPEMADLPLRSAGSRTSKKTIGPRQSKVNSDTARNPRTVGTSEPSDDTSKYPGGRNLDVDNNARNHILYHNAAPKADGLYHCPFEGDESCQHKPEKLKCNYDKFVDSHLKPYRCKVKQCGSLQFSSTACLLRHEREAHAMHGHGEKPFLCTYESCDRSVSGNGFPRHWNLRDHMRRVHNDAGPTKGTELGASPSTSVPTRTKKRKAGDNTESPVLEKNEKVMKRGPTPPAEPKEEVKAPTSMERYQKSQQELLSIVHKLQDPTSPSVDVLFREAASHFRHMHKHAQSINRIPRTTG